MTLLPKLHRLQLSLPPCPLWMRWPVFGIRLLLGIMFIISGVAKVLDARSFMDTLPLYQVPAWLVPAGMLVPPVEVVLGAALVLGIVPIVTALSTLGLLTVFCILLIVGIAGGSLDDCGCFGQYLETSPSVALLRNVVMMALAFLIWRFHRGSAVVWRQWQVGLLGLVLLILGPMTGYTVHQPLTDTSLAQVGEFFPDEGFGQLAPEFAGVQLAFVFSTDCHHCWNAVANVKTLAASADYQIFGVTASGSGEIAWFAEEFDTNFPIYPYNPDLFDQAFRRSPALYYLEDGMILGRIEDEAPSLKTLQEEHLAEWR